MDFVHAIKDTGLFARLSLLLGLGPLAVALTYVYRPSEQTLAMMRPLSLAAIFGAIAGLVSGWIAILMGVAATAQRPLPMASILVGSAEALVPLLINFGLLAVSWVLVAVGMLRVVRREIVIADTET
jgi:hypothetical protein